MSDGENNPHSCGDNGCYLLVGTRPKGWGTNGGCRCLMMHPSRAELRRVKAGILWLRARVEDADRGGAP